MKRLEALHVPQGDRRSSFGFAWDYRISGDEVLSDLVRRAYDLLGFESDMPSDQDKTVRLVRRLRPSLRIDFTRREFVSAASLRASRRGS